MSQGYRRGYYAAAAYSDSLFGILLASLEEKGFSNNTIVIMTADHVRIRPPARPFVRVIDLFENKFLQAICRRIVQAMPHE